MKFGQFLDYNMRNIFLKSDKQNVAEKLVPDQKSQLSIFLDQQYEMLYSLLELYAQIENFQNILKHRG